MVSCQQTNFCPGFCYKTERDEDKWFNLFQNDRGKLSKNFIFNLIFFKRLQQFINYLNNIAMQQKYEILHLTLIFTHDIKLMTKFSDFCSTSSTLDLIMLLDGSGSVEKKNFDIMKEWVKKIVSSFHIEDGRTRIGLKQYSSKIYGTLVDQMSAFILITLFNIRACINKIRLSRYITIYLCL